MIVVLEHIGLAIMVSSYSIFRFWDIIFSFFNFFRDQGFAVIVLVEAGEIWFHVAHQIHVKRPGSPFKNVFFIQSHDIWLFNFRTRSFIVIGFDLEGQIVVLFEVGIALIKWKQRLLVQKHQQLLEYAHDYFKLLLLMLLAELPELLVINLPNFCIYHLAESRIFESEEQRNWLNSLRKFDMLLKIVMLFKEKLW